MNRIRNFGIVAHIDGGKTTVSEHMLKLSGRLRSAGSIDSGDTALDFLEMERARGITIQSACVTMPWRDHALNLIDTPGHVDFTVEVARSLRVLDGAVLVVDGTVGVQAQTETVWRQAARHQLPRIAFLNKLDRAGAVADQLPGALDSIRRRLGVEPLPLQSICQVSPDTQRMTNLMYGGGGNATDEGDVDSGSSSFLAHQPPVHWVGVQEGDLQPSADGASEADAAIVSAAREHMCVVLAEHDATFAELWFGSVDALGSDLPASAFLAAIRRASRAESPVLPVLFGSALRGRGVAPLLDAVVDLLPAPAPGVPVAADARALAFKVIHDERRGLVVFLRMYNGTLRTNDEVLCVRTGRTHRLTRLVRVEADRFVDLREANEGEMCAAIGLDDVATGDTLIVAPTRKSGSATGKKKSRDAKNNNDDDDDDDDDGLSLPGVMVPPPVFTRTLEPDTGQDAHDLASALRLLSLEDPSLRPLLAADGSGHWVLAGMGELHLEIALDRLREHYGVKLESSDERPAYRVTPGRPVCPAPPFAYEFRTAGRPSCVLVSLSLEPRETRASGNQLALELMMDGGECGTDGGEPISIELDGEEGESAAQASPLVAAVRQGVERALMRGPRDGYSMLDCRVTVHRVGLLESTARADLPPMDRGLEALFAENNVQTNPSQPALLPYVTAAVSEALIQAMHQSEPVLLEPVMRVEFSLADGGRALDEVLADLAGRRRAIFDEMPAAEPSAAAAAQTSVQFGAMVPLVNMLNYASVLRGLTQGNGSFSMEFSHYQEK